MMSVLSLVAIFVPLASGLSLSASDFVVDASRQYVMNESAC